MAPADAPPTPTVAVIITVHNRRELTLTCLERLEEQHVDDHRLQVYLTDDGSTDGTGEAVRAAHPDVVVIDGDGSLFWNGGMRVAFERAMADDPAHYLLLNDDTHLDAGALRVLLDVEDGLRRTGRPPSIVVGGVRDPETGDLTYSGQRRGPRSRPMRFEIVEPGDAPRPADTFDGNCVLVPREVVRRIGNLDPVFTHAMGDYDYGLRAGEAGCEVWVAPGTLGECAPNPGFVQRSGSTLGEEFRRWRSIKHLPPAQWRAFTSRWAGPLWPVFYATPYARRLVNLVRARI